MGDIYMRRGNLIILKMTNQEYFHLVQLIADATVVIRYAIKTARSNKIRTTAKRCLFLLRIKNVGLKSYQYTFPAISLTGNEKRVLLNLITALDFEKFKPVYFNKLTSKLRIKKPNLSRCLKSLVQKELLIKGDNYQRYSTYRLNFKYLDVTSNDC
jgi:hypothetical protein